MQRLQSILVQQSTLRVAASADSLASVQRAFFARKVRSTKVAIAEQTNNHIVQSEDGPKAGAQQHRDLLKAQFFGQFEGVPLQRSEPVSQETTSKLLQKTTFKSLAQLLDFYEINRRFFTDNEKADECLRMFLALLRKTKPLLASAEKPQHAVSQFRMIVNDLAKMLPPNLDTLKMKETIEIFNRVISTLTALKSFQSLPSSLCLTYKEFFAEDKETVLAKIDTVHINHLCTLCRINTAADLLGLSKDDQQGILESVEHTILLRHSDSLKDLGPSQIYNLINAFGRIKLQSELLYLLEPHILKQARDFAPNKIANICSFYLRIGQGSLEFIKLLMTTVALNSATVWLAD